MTELNDAGPIEIFDCQDFSFRLKIDTSGFGQYTRQGLVEDVKVPKKFTYKDINEATRDPASCTTLGKLEPLDKNY